MLSRVLGALGPSLGIVLACSSPSENQPTLPVGGSSGSSNGAGGTTAGSAGMSETAGSAGMSETAGSAGMSETAGSAGTAGTGGCAEACTNGAVCKEGACVCPTKKTLCDGMCVATDDPDNCGECGMKCEAGAACTPTGCAPEPSELFAGTGCGRIRLASVGTTLYWIENASGKVLSLDLTAPAATPVEIAKGQLKPIGIAADASGVYWVNEGDGTAGSSVLMKKALPGAGAPVKLATGKGTPPKHVIRALALTAEGVLYTLEHDVHLVSKDAAEKADIVVGTATNNDLETPDKSDGLPSGLAISGDYVAWTTDERQGVERDDLAEGGDGYAELGESQGSILFPDIGVDGGNVFWAAAEAIRTTLIAKDTGPGYTFLTATKEFDVITAFTVVPGAVYFAGKKGSIATHSLTPAEPAVAPVAIARDQVGVSSLTVAGDQLIWATEECKLLSSALK
jgi:hypothetical protein